MGKQNFKAARHGSRHFYNTGNQLNAVHLPVAQLEQTLFSFAPCLRASCFENYFCRRSCFHCHNACRGEPFAGPQAVKTDTFNAKPATYESAPFSFTSHVSPGLCSASSCTCQQRIRPCGQYALSEMRGAGCLHLLPDSRCAGKQTLSVQCLQLVIKLPSLAASFYFAWLCGAPRFISALTVSLTPPFSVSLIGPQLLTVLCFNAPCTLQVSSPAAH